LAAFLEIGWVERVLPKTIHEFKVIINKLQIKDDNDPGLFQNGELKLWVGVNGLWNSLAGGDLGNVNSYTSIGDGGIMTYPNNWFVVSVPEDGKIILRTTGYERDNADDYFGCGFSSAGTCKFMLLALDNNDISKISTMNTHLQIILVLVIILNKADILF
jgi:hypothetical protein